MVSNESGTVSPMEFQDVVRRRRMVRDYAERIYPQGVVAPV